MIRTKCVNSPIDRKRDGLRILATRFLVRYMSKTRYDVWMPSLGPSSRNTFVAPRFPEPSVRTSTPRNHCPSHNPNGREPHT